MSQDFINEESGTIEEVTEERAEKALQEVIEGARYFEAPGLGRLKIRFPTNAEKRKADLEYAKTFSDLLDSGIKTNREMEKLLRERKIWTEEDDKAIEEKDREIQGHLLLLSKTKTKSKREEIRKKIAQLREELFALHQEKQAFLTNTVESKAEEARFAYLIHACTYNADTDERVWKTVEDFNNEENQEGVVQVIYQFMTFLRGLPADFLEYLPENESDDEEE